MKEEKTGLRLRQKEHTRGHLWYRRVWRYHRGNQNPYIEEEQTTQ